MEPKKNGELNELADLEFFDFEEPLIDLPAAAIPPQLREAFLVENEAPSPLIPTDPNPLLPQVVMPQLGHEQQNVPSGEQGVQEEETGLADEVIPTTTFNIAYVSQSALSNGNDVSPTPTDQQNQFRSLQNGGTGIYQPPLLGFPPTGEIANGVVMVVSSETVPARATSPPQQPPMAHDNAMNNQNGVQGPLGNSVYDRQFVTLGLPVDPHMRSLHKSMGHLSFN